MRILSVLLFFPIFLSSCQEPGQRIIETITEVIEVKPVDYFVLRSTRRTQEIQKAKTFLNTHPSYNQEVVFLIDMKMPSGKFRLFVYDIKKDSILEKGLVAHGSGSVYSEDSLVFSNTPNSYQSSLGNYRIGNSYMGNFGKSYKLHGLDKSNDKAYPRLVVFHPYSCVPDMEQDYPICESLGCPMISNEFIKKLYPIIDNSKKPILMVIYY